MKIAIVSTIQGCDWAGTEEVWWQFARHAIDHGHEVAVSLDARIARHPRVGFLERRGMRIFCRQPFRPYRLYLIKERIRAGSGIVDLDPDVFIVNSGSPLDVLLLPHLWLKVKRFRCPGIFFCHFNSDTLDIGDRDRLRSFLERFNHMIFVSEDNRRALIRQLAWKPSAVTVIPNRSRLELEKPLPFPENIDSVVLVSLARLQIRWKGQDILLETLSNDAWRDRSWELRLCGSGEDEEHLKRLADYFGISANVRFQGYVKNLSTVLESAHLLVLPSRGEGTPLAAVEAMMCGRPVVGTDVGGIREIIEDGSTGFIAEAPSPRCLAAALERAWEARMTWREMGIHAHHDAKELAQIDPERHLLEIAGIVARERR